MEIVNIGNKMEAVQKVLDAVNYIEQNQNSEDLQICKSMLLKIAEIMISIVKYPIDVELGLEDPNLNSSVAPDTQDQGHVSCSDCGCDGEGDGSCAINTDGKSVVPEFNIQDTMAKIQKEIEDGGR